MAFGLYLRHTADHHSVPEALERRSSAVRNEPHQPLVSESVSQNEFSVIEILWFLVNCYNLAVKVAPTWPASAVISLFDTAIRVGELIFYTRILSDGMLQITAHRTCPKTDSESEPFIEDNARKCLCYFAITVVCTAEARQYSDLNSKVCNAFSTV